MSILNGNLVILKPSSNEVLGHDSSTITLTSYVSSTEEGLPDDSSTFRRASFAARREASKGFDDLFSEDEYEGPVMGTRAQSDKNDEDDFWLRTDTADSLSLEMAKRGVPRKGDAVPKRGGKKSQQKRAQSDNDHDEFWLRTETADSLSLERAKRGVPRTSDAVPRRGGKKAHGNATDDEEPSTTLWMAQERTSSKDTLDLDQPKAFLRKDGLLSGRPVSATTPS